MQCMEMRIGRSGRAFLEALPHAISHGAFVVRSLYDRGVDSEVCRLGLLVQVRGVFG